MLINVTIGQSGLGIRLLRTNPANPFHNLRVILPGFEARHEQFPFYPLFLESLARYSEFRYMDFLHTNAHTVSPLFLDYCYSKFFLTHIILKSQFATIIS
jgi:hypothetical protein